MPRPKRADRTSIGDTFVSLRLPSHQLAAIDAAVARASQHAGRDMSRSELILSAVLRATREEGVSVDSPPAAVRCAGRARARACISDTRGTPTPERAVNASARSTTAAARAPTTWSSASWPTERRA
jgi:hypothetical protein